MPFTCLLRRTFSISLISLLIFLNFATSAQTKLNFGLNKPQPTNTLPCSREAYVKPVLKPKTKTKTILILLKDGAFNITNGWELSNAKPTRESGYSVSRPGYNTSKWFNAVVPGTVLTTLVKQGIYPDPYFGLNNLHIPDSLCRKDWWYRISFNIPPGNLHKFAFLNFDGINYVAEIWLNGQLIGKIKGAFRQGIFNVSAAINYKGSNVLAVHLLPPPDPGIPQEESPSAGTGPNGGQLCLDGPTFIATEGWDWIPGIRDRDMGIWQNVSLKFTGPVTISDPRVISRLPLPDTSQADIIVETTLQNLTAHNQPTLVRGEIGNIKFEQQAVLKPFEKRTVSFQPEMFKQLHINHPRLWWPNGYGNPALYDLKIATVANNGTISDRQTIRFGIRELSYEMTVDLRNHPNKRVEYRPVTLFANKHPIFDNIDRGKAGYGVAVAKLKPGIDSSLLTDCEDNATAPYLVIKVNGQRIYCKGGNWGMDDAMKDVSRSHLEPYFKLHKDAHFNMIRNWTGESTEQTFYDLCDEYGMLVWNDFWLSTQGYNLDVKDDSLFLNNARDVIKRFRNHPSIAIWCPRNEGYAPLAIENGLADIIANYDGTRYYQPNSRLMNLRTSGPWNYFTNPGDYEKIASGFSTELGSPSVPTAASMRKMMAKEDLWPIGDVWYYHDFHEGQKEYVAAMDSLYGEAVNLDDFCKKAQLLNYDSYRAMFEGWQSHLWNNTSGLLLWMSHPAWPSTDWQTYSWDYETFGSYFGSMKACEPVHVQLGLDDDKVSVINNTMHSLEDAQVQVTVFDASGKKISALAIRSTIQANALTAMGKADFPSKLSGVYLVRLQLLNNNNQLVSSNDYWRIFGSARNFKIFNNLKKATLKIEKISRSSYKITNTSAVTAIAIKLNLLNAKTHKIILPAYFSDGYFNLLGNESKTITVGYSPVHNVLVKADGYNL